MVSYSKELAIIRELLEKNPQGMTITDISKVLSIYRKTTAKYLDMLLITGQVEMRPLGPVKIFTPSRRIPVSSMLNFSKDYIIVLDRDLNIVELNDLVLNSHELERDDLMRKQIRTTPLPYAENEELAERLREAVNGKEFTGGIEGFTLPDMDECTLRLVPVTFNDGTEGVSLVLVDENSRKKLEENVRKREGLLRALSHLVSMAGKGKDMDAAAEPGLKRIGEGLSASRVYLCRNGIEGSEGMIFQRIAEWVGEGTEGLIGDPEQQMISYRKTGDRLAETLSRGRMYFGNIRDFLEEERDLFNPQGILSIALAPIFANGEWWGFLGADQCEREWDWSSGEMEGLKAASGIFGIIIEKAFPVESGP